MKPFNEREKSQYFISVSIPIEQTLPPHDIIMVIAKLNPSPSKTGLTSIIITLPARPSVRPGKVSSG